MLGVLGAEEAATLPDFKDPLEEAVKRETSSPLIPSSLPTLEEEIETFRRDDHVVMPVSRQTGRLIRLLERSEMHRLEAEERAQQAIGRGLLKRLQTDATGVLGIPVHGVLKGVFDRNAPPWVQIAYAMNIDGSPLDTFIRSGKPGVGTAIHVLRLIQAEAMRRELAATTPGPESPNSADIRLPAESDAGAAAPPTNAKPESPSAEVLWPDVQLRLLGMCERGDPYPGQRALAERLDCSPSTVHKALTTDAPDDQGRTRRRLQEWADSSPRAAPKATALEGSQVDRTEQVRETDPSDVLLDDDVDTVMARLIDEAPTSEDRAKLHALNPDARRALVRVHLDQQGDYEPSPLEEDPPGKRQRAVRQHKRA